MKDLFKLRLVSGKTLAQSYTSKKLAKHVRDDANKLAGFTKFCVTRGKDNLKSAKPHSRTGSK